LEVDDRFLREVVTQLAKGYAYIRVVTGRKIEGTRYTSDVNATTIGYLFEMERQPLKFDGQDSEQLTVCYRCKLAVKSPQHCPFCGKPALTTRPTVESEEVRMEGRASPKEYQQAIAATGVEDSTAAFIDWWMVRERAIIKYPEGRDIFEKLTFEQVADFITNYPNVDVQLYAELGLVKKHGDRFRLRPAGAALIDAFKEVAGE